MVLPLVPFLPPNPRVRTIVEIFGMTCFCKNPWCFLKLENWSIEGNVRPLWFARILLLASLVLAWQVPAVRADVVVLANGDRLTGQAEGLKDGKLSFKTGYAGSIQINWKEVTRLNTEGNFEVEAETGRRYRGRLEQREANLDVIYEDTSTAMPPASVVAMIPMSDGEPPGFWKILNGAIDLGYSLSRGNSDLNQSSVGIQGNYRRETYELQGSASSLFSKQDDSEPTSRQTLDLRYDRFLSPQAFAFALNGFERNDRQQLNLRSRLGGGFGWKLVKTRQSEFSVLGGFTFINERFRDADSGTMLPRKSSGEALGGVELQTTRFRGTRLSTKLSFLPNLVAGGRYRVEYDTNVRVPLYKSMTWSVKLFDRLDSEPPLNVERNDYGVVSAFGFTF